MSCSCVLLANEPHKATKLEQINKMSSRPRVLSSEELSLSSSKTHRRTSSVILDGTVHSESRCDLPDTEQRVRPRADTTSSLRTLELIRQLSFDTITPKIIDISDTEQMVNIECTPRMMSPPNTPSERMMSPPLPPNIKRLDPQVISPPLHHVVHTLNRARSTSLSEMSDGESYGATDFDDNMMMMENLPEQTGPPNRRRLASDQSPYAVSSASSTASRDHSSFCSSESEMIHWLDDPTGCIINLGINHVETSDLASELEVTQDDALGPPMCARLSIGTLKEWNTQCEKEGNVINKRQYISSALSPDRPSSMVASSQESVEVEEVHMMVAPSLSASLSYTHTGAPSTISISSEFHDVEEEVSITYEDGAALSYSQSIDQSFESSLAGDIVHVHQDKALKDTATSPAPRALRKHRRHKSDGFALQPRAQANLKKRPSHQRGSSLDLSLQSIPENPKLFKSPLGVIVAGIIVGVMATASDNSFESFVASGYSFDNDCTTDALRKHRRFNSDGHFARSGRRLQQ